MRVLWREIRGRRKRPDFERIVKEVERTLDNTVKPEVLSYFNQRIMSNLDLDVRFRARKRVTRREIIVYVFPQGPDKDIWKILSITGARPHKITPKGPGYPLAFPWGGYGSYKPKTTTSGGYKGPGTVTNPQMTYLYEVDHPGMKPRHFEQHVARWYNKRFKRHVENAVRRGTRR